MSTLFPARSVTDEPVDWTVMPEGTVRSSPGLVDGTFRLRSQTEGADNRVIRANGQRAQGPDCSRARCRARSR